MITIKFTIEEDDVGVLVSYESSGMDETPFEIHVRKKLRKALEKAGLLKAEEDKTERAAD